LTEVRRKEEKEESVGGRGKNMVETGGGKVEEGRGIVNGLKKKMNKKVLTESLGINFPFFRSFRIKTRDSR
jgi:hypothetical protein